MIFSDRFEQDILEFNSGMGAEIGIANHCGKLVHLRASSRPGAHRPARLSTCGIRSRLSGEFDGT